VLNLTLNVVGGTIFFHTYFLFQGQKGGLFLGCIALTLVGVFLLSLREASHHIAQQAALKTNAPTSTNPPGAAAGSNGKDGSQANGDEAHALMNGEGGAHKQPNGEVAPDTVSSSGYSGSNSLASTPAEVTPASSLLLPASAAFPAPEASNSARPSHLAPSLSSASVADLDVSVQVVVELTPPQLPEQSPDSPDMHLQSSPALPAPVAFHS